MKRPVVYVALQQFCETSQEPLKAMERAGMEVHLNKLGHRLKREEMEAELKCVDAVLAGVEPYDAALFAALPELKCVSRCGIGTDAVDLAAAKQHGVSVLVTIEEVIQPVAEMTVAMILALARNIPSHVLDSQSSQWKKHTGVLLSEWTVGLVGFGRIGRAVARLLSPFGAHVLVSDPVLKKTDVPEGVELKDFNALLAESDVVSLHASRQPSDGHLMSTVEFAKMKQGAFLVNTARGYMIDENALVKALDEKRLGGAALDVYENEPYKGPLMGRSNVICTPHVATLTNASRVAMELRAAQNIVEFFKASKKGTVYA